MHPAPNSLFRVRHFFALFLIALCFSCDEPKEMNNGFWVGTATRSINPEIGAFIAGDQQNRQFTGIHDSLYVKAIYVSDEEEDLVLLTFDNIGLLHPALVEIRKKVSEEVSPAVFNANNIVMSSTHTHSGPDVVGIWGPDQMTTGVDPKYMESLTQKATEAILEAMGNKTQAQIRFAQGEFGEDWVFNISDSLNLDRSLTILQFVDENEKSIATLNNFACHPTIMDAASSLVSGDYISETYKVLDQELGGTNLFLQGAIGGWVQPEYEEKTFETASQRGAELGAAIVNLLLSPDSMESTGINFKSSKVELPVSNPGFRMMSEMGVINRPMTETVSTEIAWFSIGDAQFITHPGETSPTHSKLSKELMKTSGPKFVIGLGMDALGYILTPDFFVEDPVVKHGEYLMRMSIDPSAGELMMKEIESLIATEE